MGSKDGPKQPSPTKTAAAQTQSNIETARKLAELNRVNETGPFGSVSYSQTPGTDQWSKTTVLDPTIQAAMQGRNELSQQLYQTASDHIPMLRDLLWRDRELPQQGDLSAIDAALFARLEPQLQRDREARETQLLNAGSVLGHESYGRAQDVLNRQQTDARLATLAAAGGEQSRQYRDALAGFQTGTQADLQKINAILSLSGLSPQGEAPQSATPQIPLQGVDVAGIQQQAFNNQLAANQQSQAGLGGLFGLGGAILGGAGAAGGFSKLFS